MQLDRDALISSREKLLSEISALKEVRVQRSRAFAGAARALPGDTGPRTSQPSPSDAVRRRTQLQRFFRDIVVSSCDDVVMKK